MSAAAAIAAVLGIPHQVIEVARAASEGDLRRIRYAALEAEADPGEVLVSGHTADDQVETVLAHLLRGSGAAGVAGIPPRRGRWVRPLLAIHRSEVRAAASELDLPVIDDPANEDRGALRNRIRHDLLPLLRDQVNPAVDEALLRTAAHLRDDEALIEMRAAAVPLRVEAGEVRIPAAALVSLPSAAAARVARRALRLVFAPYPGGERDVGHVLRVAAGAAECLPLAEDYLAEREGPWVTVHRAGPLPMPMPVLLPVPGVAEFGRWRITAEPQPTGPAPIGRRRVDVHLDPGSELTVRGAGPGDRIEIGSGSKPVAEALREAGIPARLRSGWPVVETGGRMVWIAGARAAEWCTPAGRSPVTRLALGEAT
jgi:tRNA(Ile)-lysidine synthase